MGGNKKDDKNYVFPNPMAKLMASIDQRTQYEASMMSILFILLGIIIMGFYAVFFSEMSLFMKIMISVNTGAGFMFLFSNLVTTYQQYRSYLEALDVLLEVNK